MSGVKQKIVIKVQVHNEKCRRKAFKIAVVEKGVSSVSIEGADKDNLVVIGEGVDSVCLARALRKKFHRADIVSVNEVKDKDGEKEETKPLPPIPIYSPFPPCMVSERYDSSCVVM